jgi:hypothetical protein
MGQIRRLPPVVVPLLSELEHGETQEMTKPLGQKPLFVKSAAPKRRKCLSYQLNAGQFGR